LIASDETRYSKEISKLEIFLGIPSSGNADFENLQCLSAKAVVDMMCGGDPDIPGCYRVSGERLERARGLESVSVTDEKGTLY
jgi:hypothetical protein